MMLTLSSLQWRDDELNISNITLNGKLYKMDSKGTTDRQGQQRTLGDTDRISLNVFPHFHGTWPNNKITKGRRSRKTDRPSSVSASHSCLLSTPPPLNPDWGGALKEHNLPSHAPRIGFGLPLLLHHHIGGEGERVDHTGQIWEQPAIRSFFSTVPSLGTMNIFSKRITLLLLLTNSEECFPGRLSMSMNANEKV